MVATASAEASVAADLAWHVKTLEELSVSELYHVLELRQRVFVLEQSCLFPDIDNADDKLLHLLAYDGPTLVAYSRMGNVGTSSYAGALTIGRVIVQPEHRGRGLFYPLMQRSIDAVRSAYGQKLPITIGAQAHLQRLYGRLGFVPVSDQCDDDGILHIDMTLAADNGDDQTR
jgi:ElaA protein